jgi:hypothetical protein
MIQQQYGCRHLHHAIVLCLIPIVIAAQSLRRRQDYYWLTICAVAPVFAVLDGA